MTKLNYLITTALLTATSCQTKITMDIQGHRGCRGIMPENTLQAFKKAIDLNVTTLELDVVLSADQQVVVSHEPWLNYEITTLPNGDTIKKGDDKKYNLFLMPYAQIKTYDVGMRQHPRFLQQQKFKAYKPLLIEVFNAVKEKCNFQKKTLPQFNIEIKSTPQDSAYQPTNTQFVNIVMQTILAANMQNYITIQSFDYRNLEIMHNLYPTIKLAMLIDENEKADFDYQIKKLSFIPNIISPHYSLATQNFITTAHKNNCKVIPWTVNNLATARQLTALKVDGIITDYPNIINANTIY